MGTRTNNLLRVGMCLMENYRCSVTVQAVVQVWDGFAVAADPRLQKKKKFPLASGHLLKSNWK